MFPHAILKILTIGASVSTKPSLSPRNRARCLKSWISPASSQAHHASNNGKKPGNTDKPLPLILDDLITSSIHWRIIIALFPPFIYPYSFVLHHVVSSISLQICVAAYVWEVRGPIWLVCVERAAFSNNAFYTYFYSTLIAYAVIIIIQEFNCGGQVIMNLILWSMHNKIKIFFSRVFTPLFLSIS